jgi:hypothetical protein
MPLMYSFLLIHLFCFYLKFCEQGTDLTTLTSLMFYHKLDFFLKIAELFAALWLIFYKRLL